MKNKQHLMELFEENEFNIANLYSLYAQKIPDKYEFWQKLSREEISHASAIKSKKGEIDTIIENKFSRGVISYIMDFVTEEIKSAKKEKIHHKKALKTALRIERSMLEKKCFDIFIPTDKKIKEILLKLNKETEEHVERLMKEMKNNKFVF